MVDVLFNEHGIVYARLIVNDDSRRTLMPVFNSVSLGDFVARQVKIAVLKEDSVLGGHYHKYTELFSLVEGEASFALKAVDDDFTKELTLIPGYSLLIPPRIAHKVYLLEGSVLIGCTSEAYFNPEVNDKKYNF